MQHVEYLLLLALCLLITLPLEFLFRARVYRRPLRTLAVIAAIVVVFGNWDTVAVRGGLWTYNPRFVTGIEVPGGLPLEEVLFFVAIPLCALLTFNAVGTVLGWAKRLLGGTRNHEK